MAGADSVDVELFHYLDVLNHTLASHHIALQRIHLVTVYTLNQYWLTIYKQLCVLNLRCAETNSLGIRLGCLFAVACADYHLVEVWLLG